MRTCVVLRGSTEILSLCLRASLQEALYSGSRRCRDDVTWSDSTRKGRRNSAHIPDTGQAVHSLQMVRDREGRLHLRDAMQLVVLLNWTPDGRARSVTFPWEWRRRCSSSSREVARAGLSTPLERHLPASVSLLRRLLDGSRSPTGDWLHVLLLGIYCGCRGVDPLAYRR